MAHRLTLAALCVLLLAALMLDGGPVLAQGVPQAPLVPMADPTRPPTGVASETQVVGEVTGPVLQSVKIPKKGVPVAMIGGQHVKLGEMYGDSKLVRLTEKEAVLEGPGGTERLQLTPGIEKTNIVMKKNAANSKQNRGMP